MRGGPTDPVNPEILLIRRFSVPPDRVFRAWTEPDALKAWWCPPGWVPAAITIDLRIGGSYRIAMRRPGSQAEVAVSGHFVEVLPPQRLRYTWRWEGAFDGMPEGLVTVEFAGDRGGTVLTLRHEEFAEAGLRQQHRSGWLAACNRLDRALAPMPGFTALPD
jgi:uncharacterized protein YndB with AHSA1/START domain